MEYYKINFKKTKLFMRWGMDIEIEIDIDIIDTVMTDLYCCTAETNNVVKQFSFN